MIRVNLLTSTIQSNPPLHKPDYTYLAPGLLEHRKPAVSLSLLLRSKSNKRNASRKANPKEKTCLPQQNNHPHNNKPTPASHPPFNTTPDALTLITQGAEALLYRTTFLTPSTPAALKIRLRKPWRHPALDARLTRQRVLAESRVLLKCAREGVAVPAVLGVGCEEGWVAVEWVEGGTVKEAVRGRVADGEEGEAMMKDLMRRIGAAVGKLHSVGVVHGDLTTSNMMLRRMPATKENGGTEEGKAVTGNAALAGEIVLIDFGLAVQTVQEEDRAVDLYVLERAFGSTHPREEGMFGELLEGYRVAFKGSKGTLRRLEDVRMRGRKKSMIG
ncbi:hypothetical protein Q7P36_005151 [Cladosporium allicinum]